ncbi:MAG: Fe-Mn family superoxide dismutase [Vampirovibrionales bacterium]|nr:Fe-Mn family superoxide dismutase [Vampirovibrionales bacterium]
MPLTQVKPYEAVTYNLQLDGISQPQLEEHYKLYGGYVTNTNTLNDKMAELIAAGKFSTPEYNELRRRFGFEYCGMRLHEYYFGALKQGVGALDKGSKLYKKIEEDFGSYDAWEADFKASGMIRGIGWVVLYQDPQNGRLQNFWISDHELGHPAGFTPILVMDVWEHAYSVDYKPTGRKAYIDAYFKNINWPTVESRLK